MGCRRNLYWRYRDTNLRGIENNDLQQQLQRQSPGKYYRKGLSLVEDIQQFGNDEAAHDSPSMARWPESVRCACCESERISNRTGKRQTPQFYCKDCEKNFTVNTNTMTNSSRLPSYKWTLAFYRFNVPLKGVSSLKLHRDLDIAQETAVDLDHRMRQSWIDTTGAVAQRFAGPVEADRKQRSDKGTNCWGRLPIRKGKSIDTVFQVKVGSAGQGMFKHSMAHGNRPMWTWAYSPVLTKA